MPQGRTGHSHTRGDRKVDGRGYAPKLPESETGLRSSTHPRITAVCAAQLLPAVFAAEPKAAVFNVDAQLLQMVQDLFASLARKDDGEFFSAASVSLSSTGYAREA